MRNLRNGKPIGIKDKFGALPNMALQYNRDSYTTLNFSNMNNWIFLGDSIMFGMSATVGNSYRELLTEEYAVVGVNSAVSSRGVWREIANIVLAPFTRDETVIFASAGLNDLRRSDNIKTSNKIESSLNCIVARAFASSQCVASGGASVTRVGSFASYPASTYAGTYPSGAIGANVASYSSTINNTWTWSFTGDNVFITFAASDGAGGNTRGNCEVRIDGNLVETITDLNARWDGVSDGDNANTLGPDARFYTGLASGSHSIEIKVTSADFVVVDQLGVLDDPANVGNLMVNEIPYIVDYSGVGLDNASDAKIDAANALREAIVDRFAALGYNILFNNIMSTTGGLYDLANISGDDIHPSTAGHLQIYNSIIRGISKPTQAFIDDYSLLLDGSAEYVNVDSTQSALSSTTAGGFSAWFKPVDSTPSSVEVLFSFGDTNSTSEIILYLNTNGTLIAFANIAGVLQWNLTTTSAELTSGVWSKVALYTDGVEPFITVGGVKVSQNFTVSTSKNVWFNSIPLIDNGTIGARRISSTTTLHFNGNVDEFIAFDGAVTEAQDLVIYNGGTPKDERTVANGVTYIWFGDSVQDTYNTSVANEWAFKDMINGNTAFTSGCELADVELDTP